MSRPHDVTKADVDGLSPKQRQVFLLLGQGLSQKEIINRLGISKATVSSHLIGIGLKLGLAHTSFIYWAAARYNLLCDVVRTELA